MTVNLDKRVELPDEETQQRALQEYPEVNAVLSEHPSDCSPEVLYIIRERLKNIVDEIRNLREKGKINPNIAQLLLEVRNNPQSSLLVSTLLDSMIKSKIEERATIITDEEPNPDAPQHPLLTQEERFHRMMSYARRELDKIQLYKILLGIES